MRFKAQAVSKNLSKGLTMVSRGFKIGLDKTSLNDNFMKS